MQMTSKQTTRPVLSDAELAELLGLIKEADTVELKVTVPDSDLRSAAQALGMDPLDAQIRQVYFFDTPDLTLYEHGLVVRARRVQRKGDDSVVKLRPVVPDELPADLRQSKGFGVEVDAMPGGFVCSALLQGHSEGAGVRETVAGGASAPQALLEGAARPLRRVRAGGNSASTTCRSSARSSCSS